jgi:hypothetical protein
LNDVASLLSVYCCITIQTLLTYANQPKAHVSSVDYHAVIPVNNVKALEA